MSQYIFTKPSTEMLAELDKKILDSNQLLYNNNMLRFFRRSYEAYYNMNISTGDPGNQSVGEQGEFVSSSINHFRNLLKHIFTLVTQNRMVFDALAENSDVSSLYATKVANAVLEHFFYHEKYEEELKAALEMALLFGSSYVGVLWEPNDKLVGVDELGLPVYKGKPIFKYFSPLDVYQETWKDNPKDQQWIITREQVNRWDLVAMYPELEERIVSLPAVQDLQRVVPLIDLGKDNVFLYRLYHKSTPALPDGRYTIFCDDNLLISDTFHNPYEGIPIIPLVPERRYGSSYGFSTAYDLLPLQDSTNFLHSTVLSNQQAFGSQNVIVWKESDVEIENLGGGLKIIKVGAVQDAPNAGAPSALNLLETPAEIFRYMESLIQNMEAISGVNSAVRGQPGGQLSSGTAIALVSAAAQSFNSNIEAAYVNCAERCATQLIHILQKYVTEEELIAVVGKTNTYAIRSFKGDDLAAVRQVRISVGNPLSKTLAGKLEIANQMLTNGLIKTPEQYIEVLQTGNTSGIMEEATSEETLIRSENDMLTVGQKPQMLWTDNHIRHLQAHKTLLSRQDIRYNPELLQTVLQHIQEHMDQMEQMAMGNPMSLSVALGQPIPSQAPGNNAVMGALGGTDAAGVDSTSGMSPEQAAQMEGVQTADQAAEEGGVQGVAASAERRAEKQAAVAEALV